MTQQQQQYPTGGHRFPAREYGGRCARGHRTYLVLRSLEPLTTCTCHVEHCEAVMGLCLLPPVGEWFGPPAAPSP
jgi:hypothetical protein